MIGGNCSEACSLAAPTSLCMAAQDIKDSIDLAEFVGRMVSEVYSQTIMSFFYLCGSSSYSSAIVPHTVSASIGVVG